MRRGSKGWIKSRSYSTNDLTGREVLSHEEKEGLNEAIAQMDAGMGIANEKVMAKYKKKFNA